MLEILREGIKSSEKLATLPFRVLREITGDANKTVTEVAEISENIISIPFRLANQAIGDFAVEEEATNNSTEEKSKTDNGEMS